LGDSVSLLSELLSIARAFRALVGPRDTPTEEEGRRYLEDKFEAEAGARTVKATVFAVLSDFRQVRVKTADGYQYAITENTPGVDWAGLHEGQRLECTVTTSLLPTVLHAHALD
jgi:hypothetical protein